MVNYCKPQIGRKPMNVITCLNSNRDRQDYKILAKYLILNNLNLKMLSKEEFKTMGKDIIRDGFVEKHLLLMKIEKNRRLI